MDTIRSQMTTPVISIYSEAPRSRGGSIDEGKGYRLPVGQGCQGYVGVLAEPDLVYRLVSEGLDPRTTPLSSIMEESILSIDLNASASEAGSLMQEYNISHLAVTENEEIAGILSVKDLVHKNKTFA